MPDLSYNDEQNQALELRHLFLPSRAAVISETIVAVVALVLLNLSTFSEVLSGNSGITVNPLSLWSRVINKGLDAVQRYDFVQHLLVFLLWALVGALIYVLLFRLLQAGIRTRDSVRQGAVLIETQHSQGVLHYFASLHDFLLKLIIGVGGTAAILIGTLLCFAIASQELSSGFVNTFPASAGNFLISFIGALIGVRVITVGISLLSPRFRFWYNT